MGETHAISDADLNWTLSFLRRAGDAIPRARAMAVLSEIRPMSAAQKAKISLAIKPYLNSTNSLDEIGVARVQTAIAGKLWTAADGKQWEEKHGYPWTAGKPIK